MQAALAQCRLPSGWKGQRVLRGMNRRHSRVTDWGMSQVAIRISDTVLDVGCGGGRTLAKLAALASEGGVSGVDHSPASVAMAARLNREAIASGRIEVREASVERLPYPNGSFDVATAIETHFWWPDIGAGLREIRRVLKPGGRLALIAEVHRGANGRGAKFAERFLPAAGLKLLSADEHREILAAAGFNSIRVVTQGAWICATGSLAVGSESK